MTNVLVTGASGHVGRAVVAELARRGYGVTALVRQLTDLKTQQIVGNLAQPEVLATAAATADAVVHLACARSNHRDAVIREDIAGTARLLDGWRAGNFVFASSQTVYGVPRGRLTESSPLDAGCWYDIGKICNEFQITLTAEQHGRGHALNMRLAVLFGPARRTASAPQFLEPIFQALTLRSAFLFGSTDGVDAFGTSFIGPADVGRAFAEALGVEQSGTYNVAGPFCTWRDLLQELGRASGLRPVIRVRPGAIPEPGEFRLPQSRSEIDTSRFAALCGFAPTQDVRELVEQFVRSQSR